MRATLLSLMLIGLCWSGISWSDESQYERACVALEMDCSLIPPPQIVTTQLVFTASWGQWSGVYYKGEDVIFISPFLLPSRRAPTIFHETVHYLLYKNGQRIGRCQSEETARKLTALEFNTDYNEEWKDWYGCE